MAWFSRGWQSRIPGSEGPAQRQRGWSTVREAARISRTRRWPRRLGAALGRAQLRNARSAALGAAADPDSTARRQRTVACFRRWGGSWNP
jgi:hypothetical protein